MEGEGIEKEAIFEQSNNEAELPRLDPFDDDPQSIAEMIRHKHKDDPNFEIDNLEIV